MGKGHCELCALEWKRSYNLTKIKMRHNIWFTQTKTKLTHCK